MTADKRTEVLRVGNQQRPMLKQIEFDGAAVLRGLPLLYSNLFGRIG